MFKDPKAYASQLFLFGSGNSTIVYGAYVSAIKKFAGVPNSFWVEVLYYLNDSLAEHKDFNA